MMPMGAEEQASARSGAERKLVSVMFADIVGSSAMVSGRDPEDADRALRAVLTVLTDAIERYDGTIGQMLGDGMLALFGAPNAQEDHALRACLAAQDMRTAAAEVGSGFAVRIGVATGEVLAEVIEHKVWSDYRTVGECVHLAAKMQQKAAANSVLLSRKTVELVPVGLTVQPAGLLRLSADTEPHPVFAMADVRAARRTATDLMTAATGPFVGRGREREALLAAYEAAGDGVDTVVLVSGEAGIGKSRLVSEMLNALPGEGHALLQWPQAPIRRLGEPDDLELVAASLVPLAGGPDQLCAATERAAGALELAAVRSLLSLPVANALWNGLQPAERLAAAIDGLAAVTAALSQARPLVVLVEDVHWARPVMRRFLNALVQATGEARMLFVATTRTESGTPWTPDVDALSIRLEPLPPESTQEYLNRWLGPAPSLAGIKEMLTARSQGVPLYLEESLRALEAAGAIIGAPGYYRLGTAAERVELPASVHGLLAARIDSLPNDLRRTLMTAAVIGPTFDVGLLRRQGMWSDAELSRRLAELEGRAFIRRSRLIPNLEYSFRHGLIQEVAYATITHADRRTLHAQVLEALRERRDHDLPGRMELMAHHAFRAEIWPAAYACGRAAGRRAEQRSKLEEASLNYGNALTAVERMPDSRRNTLRRIDLSTLLPRALLPRGETGVDGYLMRARDLARTVGDRVRFARASSVHAAFEWAHGDIDQAIRLSREGLASVDERDSLEIRFQLLSRLGGVLAEKGQFSDGCAALEQAEALLSEEELLKRYGLAVVAGVGVNGNLSRALAELGKSEASIQAGMRAVEIAEESGHPFSKVFANEYFGWALLLLGEIEHSLPALENALTLCDLTRSQLHKPRILAALGYANMMLGNTERGLGLMERCIAGFSREGVMHREAQTRIWHADALLRIGRVDDALREAQRALQLAQRSGRLGYEARAAYMVAEAAWKARRYDTSAALALERAASLAQQLSMALLAEQCAGVRARRGLDAVLASVGVGRR